MTCPRVRTMPSWAGPRGQTLFKLINAVLYADRRSTVRGGGVGQAISQLVRLHGSRLPDVAVLV
jgi:hypothetical protein